MWLAGTISQATSLSFPNPPLSLLRQIEAKLQHSC